MEFFKVTCPGSANVLIDGIFQGETMDGADPRVFQCNTGMHDITLECLDGKQCLEPVKRVQIKNTNPILPMEVTFSCL